jgi:hypothetical protein
MEKRRFFALRDIAVVVLILFAAVAALLAINRGESGRYGEILCNNEVIERVDLSRDGEFNVEGFENVVFSVKDGRVAFLKSDCPDKVCVRTGYIETVGQSAVCLPNRLTLRIMGEKNEIDGFTG